MKILSKMNNGAIVLAYCEQRQIVLAYYNGEYVTWYTEPNGEAYWGNYFRDFNEAAEDFKNRALVDG